LTAILHAVQIIGESSASDARERETISSKNSVKTHKLVEGGAPDPFAYIGGKGSYINYSVPVELNGYGPWWRLRLNYRAIKM
jgi:hypothetical protein